MKEKEIIKCAFCAGRGTNPFYRGTCPVCKGRGKNEVAGKYMPCSSCRGCGQKGGTTLSCYDCGGLGIVPDTRETFKQAREEIREAQEEMDRERPARRSSPVIKITPASPAGRQKSQKHKLLNIFLQRKDEEESGGKTHFCQCCAGEVNESIQIRICHDCFGKMKDIV